RPLPATTLFPYTTLFRSAARDAHRHELFDVLVEIAGHLLVVEAADEDVAMALGVAQHLVRQPRVALAGGVEGGPELARRDGDWRDRKSTRLNSSHVSISY